MEHRGEGAGALKGDFQVSHTVDGGMTGERTSYKDQRQH